MEDFKHTMMSTNELASFYLVAVEQAAGSLLGNCNVCWLQLDHVTETDINQSGRIILVSVPTNLMKEHFCPFSMRIEHENLYRSPASVSFEHFWDGYGFYCSIMIASILDLRLRLNTLLSAFALAVIQ